MSVPVYENFDNALGEFPNYDTYDSGQRTQLALQKHVNIRSFVQNSLTEPFTMLLLDEYQMTALDLLTMAQLETLTVVQGENWTNGAVGPQSDRNNFSGISLACGTGETDTQSVMTQTVNISAFATPDYLSLSLPAYPNSSITRSSSFIDLSVDGLTTEVSLAFSSATFTATGSDYEARFPISLVTGIDVTRINAVRFRIVATGSCTFRCLSIRAISATWDYAPIDKNTFYKRLGATVPPSGSLSQTYSFPTALSPVTPTDWPILLFSDGNLGPTVVNVDLGFTIQTGSNLATNTFTVYLRELPMLWTTITTMDTYSMSFLEGLTGLPDWTPEPLDNFADTQSIQVTVKWGTTNQLILFDTISGTSYTYSLPALTTSSNYYVLVQLEGNSLRVRILPQDGVFNINWSTPTFDSTSVIDESFNRRRLGRLGWYAQLKEGNTFIYDFRPRRLVYGEYRSTPLPSITPVTGAQVYSSATPDQQLYNGSIATTGATITPDVTKSSSGHCLKVQCDGLLANEGLITSTVTFDNLIDAVISFDVLSPFPLTALLIGEGRAVALNVPPFTLNHWSHVELPLEAIGNLIIPGPYQLYLIQSNNQAGSFYIDNLSFIEAAVSWQGRVPAADPWNQNNPPWIKYNTRVNSPYDGALLGAGNTLQVRGQLLDQGGFIDRVKILPKYATLGNFVWQDQAPAYGSPPVPSFVSSAGTNPLTITFNATATTFSTSTGFYRWNFGDGNVAFGEVVTYTYQTAGVYTVTLTAIDDLGQKVSTTQNLAIGGYKQTVLNDTPTSYWRLDESGNARVALDQMGRLTPNIVTNPSFEADLAGWAGAAGPAYAGPTTFITTTAQAQSGSQSAQVITTTTIDSGVSFALSSLAANTTYQASAYLRGNSGGENVDLVVRDTTNSINYQPGGGGFVTLTNGWVRYSFSFTTGAATSSQAYFFFGTHNTVSINFFLDSVQLVVGSTLPAYYEGNGGYDGDYTGSFAPNLCTTPLDANSTTGWSTATDGLGLQAGITSFATDNTVSLIPIGTYAAKFVANTSNAQQGAGFAITGTFQSGVTYTFSAYMKGNAGGEQIYMVFGDNSSGDHVFQSFTLTTSWQQFNVQWTPTANRTTVRADFATVGAHAYTWWANAVQITQTPNVVPYSDTQGITFGQTGAITGDTDTAVLFDNPGKGNGNSYTLYGGANVVPLSKIGSLFTFPCSFEFWANPTSGSNTSGTAFEMFGCYGGGNAWMIAILSNLDVYCYGSPWPASGFFPAAGPLTAGSWAQIFVTIDASSNAKFYLNATLQASGVMSGALTPTTNLYIGGGGDQPFGGIIDEVTVYSYALSPSRVMAHYLAGTTLP